MLAPNVLPTDDQSVAPIAEEIDLAEAPPEYAALLAAEMEFDEAELFPEFEDQPNLLVDTDAERAVARQKEMMDTCFGGIGEETKEEKRMGLAMQQLDIEQRHALRLLLIYQDPAELTAHLQRCLAEPAYGYGERGDQGRTIAQSMAAVSENGDLAAVVAAWLAQHQEFQQKILSGTPLNFRSLFDYADLDSFVPLLQRVGENSWRLGLEGQGKIRDFAGPMAEVWPKICDTYVEWSDEDNQQWLNTVKQQAARLPDSILRAARADRLRKEKEQIEVKGSKISLITEKDGADWPRMITLRDDTETGMIGLSRLSGHSFYELAWNGGLNVRRFELSSTTRNRVPFEHIELATALAEALGAEYQLNTEPVSAAEVEAAYLRRMKATQAEIGPAQLTQEQLPAAIQGSKPVASYKVGNIVVTMLHGGDNFAYITVAGSQNGLLLYSESKKEVIAAYEVVRGRPRRNLPFMTTSLAELNLKESGWNRAVCSWGAWLASVLMFKDNKV